MLDARCLPEIICHSFQLRPHIIRRRLATFPTIHASISVVLTPQYRAHVGRDARQCTEAKLQPRSVQWDYTRRDDTVDTSGGSVFLSVVALNDEIVVILLWEACPGPRTCSCIVAERDTGEQWAFLFQFARILFVLLRALKTSVQAKISIYASEKFPQRLTGCTASSGIRYTQLAGTCWSINQRGSGSRGHRFAPSAPLYRAPSPSIMTYLTRHTYIRRTSVIFYAS